MVIVKLLHHATAVLGKGCNTSLMSANSSKARFDTYFMPQALSSSVFCRNLHICLVCVRFIVRKCIHSTIADQNPLLRPLSLVDLMKADNTAQDQTETLPLICSCLHAHLNAQNMMSSGTTSTPTEWKYPCCTTCCKKHSYVWRYTCMLQQVQCVLRTCYH